jgi:hypothetical protein
MIQSSTEGTASGRYSALEVDRLVFLQRARDCAEFTIPALFPPQGHNGSTKYYTPYQSVGARGVNNLASKLLLALLPPEASFFRLSPDPKVAAEIEKSPDARPDDLDKLEAALSDMEQIVLADIAARGVRIRTFEGLKQLIVGGNTLLHLPDKGLRVFRLDQYVVQRDPSGNVLEIVVKELVAPNTLPDEIKEVVLAKIKAEKTTAGQTDEKTDGDNRTLELYTWVKRGASNWTVCQEVKGIKLPDSEGSYPLEKCPWLPLRWTRIDGESYGRGHCEEYIGDLASLESLSKVLVQAGAVAGKVLIMVKPGSTTRPESLANKPNGAVVEGDPDDVKAFQLDKNLDLQFVSNLVQAMETRLSFAFLLNSAVQRNGERVTAEEIRFMAQELEGALGGVYSLLADEFQLPVAKLVMMQLEKDHKLPKLPEGTVNPSVVTGLDALGRSHELSRLDAALQGAVEKFGPQVMPYIDISDYLTRRFSALGIKTKGLVRSSEEVQAMQAQAQQQEMVNKLGPSAMQAGAKVLTGPAAQAAAAPTQEPQQ